MDRHGRAPFRRAHREGDSDQEEFERGERRKKKKIGRNFFSLCSNLHPDAAKVFPTSSPKTPAKRKSQKDYNDGTDSLDFSPEQTSAPNHAKKRQTNPISTSLSSSNEPHLMKTNHNVTSRLKQEVERLKQENGDLKQEIAKMSPATAELRKIRNLMKARIIVVCSDEDELALNKTDVGTLISKYETAIALGYSKKRGSSSDQQGTREQYEELLSKYEKLKSERSADNHKETLMKLSQLSDAMEQSRDESKRVKKLEEDLKNAEENLKNAEENLKDIKTKLSLQMDIRSTYESQQNQIMDVLGIPKDDRSFAKILNSLKDWKASSSNNDDLIDSADFQHAQKVWSQTE